MLATASSRSALLLAAYLVGACSGETSAPRARGDAGVTEGTSGALSASATASTGAPAGPEPPAPSARSAPTAAASGQPADADAPAASHAPLSTAVAVVGGQDIPIERDGSTVVDASASFRVEFAVPLADGRLALHDEQDAMVASSGTSEVGVSWTRYRLVPDEPLRPGTTYALRVDGAATREVHDPGGRAYAPLVLKVKTAGERPAPPAPAKKKRGKRRT